MFGVACGDARWLYQGAMQPAKLYTVLVGPTAFGGRKGTAYSVASDVFKRACAIEDLIVSGVASGEGIAGHFVRNPNEPRALALEPEFSRLLASMSRDGSTLSAVLRNAWDDVPLGHSRSRDEAQVRRHHLGLLGPHHAAGAARAADHVGRCQRLRQPHPLAGRSAHEARAPSDLPCRGHQLGHDRQAESRHRDGTAPGPDGLR